MRPYAIHWFRRDLRVAGNKSLQELYQKYDGRVLGLFCFDKDFLSRDDFSVNRFQFFLETLKVLQDELKALGSELLVLDTGPKKSFPEILNQITKENKNLPSTIAWNRDYEPFALERDEYTFEFLINQEIEVLTFRDHLLIEPEELEKGAGGGYQVFTPFSKKWLELFDSELGAKRVKEQASGFKYISNLEKGKVDKVFKMQWSEILPSKGLVDSLENYLEANKEKVDIPIPEAGTLASFKALKKFKKKINDYGNGRDIPSLEQTSRISHFLKNGTITISQVINYLNLSSYKKPLLGADKFFSELIWREFYYHILYRFPRVEKEAFILKYVDIKWENNKDFFERWKKGETGFPIVDAGMRELNSTGYMHNRVRMIVASFLTKDLLIDWRWGEKYFMDKLLDGDLAPNNGGWQWAASTGCDPQPYFRIFNPWLQSKRFDKEGEYIKKFVPELKDIDAKLLHAPILNHPKYPSPIVDHKNQREKALRLFK